MGRIYLKLTKGKWEEVEKSDFWIDESYLHKLNSLLYIQNKDWDGVIVIDGKERSGKSVLGMITGWYLSKGKIGIDNFARGLDDAAKKISTLPDKSILILDEGSLVFSSKDSTTSVQKKLIKLMDVIGQKNMIFIICLPCFFDLNKTIAVRRSLWLCHVYPNARYDRGQYAFWGEKNKKMLYIYGKKNYDSYAFPNAELVGEYMNFEPPFYKDYLDKVKKESMEEVMEDAKGVKVNVDEVKVELERTIARRLNERGLTQQEGAEVMNISKTTYQNRLRKEITPIPLAN